MLTWMLYVVSVTLLLGCAALFAERGARFRRSANRWYWFAAIVASLIVPVAIASVSLRLPRISGILESSEPFALREFTLPQLSPVLLITGDPAGSSEWALLDPHLRMGWQLASGALLLLLVISATQLYLRRRSWTTSRVAGVAVDVAPGVGPAVVGLLRPRIVVPRWLLDMPAPFQAAVIAHEQEHLRARDPQLFTLALALLVIMPWNLPMWWQLARLRRAMEVDCDARVLRTGLDPLDYGRTLVAVGERGAEFVGAVAGMSESGSFLEQRIKIMLRKPEKWWSVAASALAGLALGAVAIAASVSPPAAQGIPAPDGAAIEVATTVLDSYVGDYLFGELQLTTISRQGNQLVMKTVPQTEIPLIARGPRLFEIKRPRESVPVATIEFMADSAGRVLALVIHQNGADITMRRIDAAAAARTRVQVSNRVQNQAADPRTAAALRRFIDGVVAGAPDYAELGPQLAAETRRQLPDMQKLLTGLGPLRELGFRGVGNAGWDLYDARYERGTLQWRIVLDSAGIITGLLVNEGP